MILALTWSHFFAVMIGAAVVLVIVFSFPSRRLTRGGGHWPWSR